ncbi:MAG TPA: zinc ribbon domain-containing protein [Polyangiaceae bacterium]|jgi:putative FmdB family regulatory protein|nr:zinc ribbon domain-containing protein [Polyangiaceae bacterium]
MPTYEYVCKSCGNTWEASQRISESPLTECPKCHEPTAQRLISGGNFILKGGGWYSDLYSSTSNKSSSASSGSSESKGEKSETKSETKTESKTDAKTPSTPAPAKKD